MFKNPSVLLAIVFAGATIYGGNALAGKKASACHLIQKYNPVAHAFDTACIGGCSNWAYPNCDQTAVTSGGYISYTCDCWNSSHTHAVTPPGVLCYGGITLRLSDNRIITSSCVTIECSQECPEIVSFPEPDNQWHDACPCGGS